MSYTVYRQTVDNVHDTSNLINKVGWDGVKQTADTSAILKMETQCLFDAEVSEELKTLVKMAIEKNILRPAAVVECDTLEDCFGLTQSLNHIWVENDECTEIKSDEAIFWSSSSTGDIVKDDESGVIYITLSVGFAQIS